MLKLVITIIAHDGFTRTYYLFREINTKCVINYNSHFENENFSGVGGYVYPRFKLRKQGESFRFHRQQKRTHCTSLKFSSEESKTPGGAGCALIDLHSSNGQQDREDRARSIRLKNERGHNIMG